ncbi:Carboxypeptidase C (cathepsin A) [Pseudarcicella hirudinis]|uniref:Carboxypeptidase C (Cathepsin A) n=1 Tax=Pseudarcicella hirudinis TaxID=1079859 RepID=A0A1I5YSM9_9BACT|nr:peptidase S10 [Pseudarcicella hirudinis]SFQ46877.1 Carboxypeptidase C (cathepsin A) [Pseudarcicella hirudinis]
MKKYLLPLLVLLTHSLQAQEPAKKEEPKPVIAASQSVNPVITKHQTTINGQTFSYTATTGYMTLKDESGKAKANIFYIAYTKDGVSDISKRPVTYTFNGGPGSASVWLHMGCIGPKRILMSDKGESLAPPYKYVNSEYSWLDKTDLVFIDPVNTGYSRAAQGEDEKQFLGYTGDIESVGEFIRLYTVKYGRWASPKFLAGESYGTTRAAGLSGYLQDKFNMYINGVALISSILNFQTARFEKGNDLPYPLFLPTYTAMAWYHKKVAPEYQGDLLKTLREVENFALNDYTLALTKGDMLPEMEKNRIIEKLSKFTGLSQAYIRNTDMRIEISRFVKELLRTEGKTAGRLDGRFTGTDFDNAGERNEFDPSLDATISGPYSASINHYLRQELKYENDLPYLVLTGRVQPWSYNNVQNQYLNVAETLRQAMAKNPYLKVWVGAGYYDLATPYFAAEYTVAHMGLKPEQRKNVNFTYFEAGHMMYIHKESLIKLKKDADKFYDEALK